MHAFRSGCSWIRLDTGFCGILYPVWIQLDTGYSWIRCVQLRSRSAAFSLDTGLRSAAFRNLRSAAFCVRLRSCVQLRSAFCVQLRSAFGCVLRSAAFRNLRSAAFCVQLRSAWIQPGVIQSFWVGILCRQGRYAWTHTCCDPSLAARNVNTHALLPGPDLCPSNKTIEARRVVRMHAAGFVSIYY